MSYFVSAWLERGGPRLGIFSSDTGVLQQQWHLEKIADENGENKELQKRCFKQLKRPGIQELTRELFLVSCAQEIAQQQSNLIEDISKLCLECNQCISDQHENPHWGLADNYRKL